MSWTFLAMVIEDFVLSTIKSPSAVAKLKGQSGRIRGVANLLNSLADKIDAKTSLKKKK